MLGNSFLRYTLCTFLAALAGASFCLSVLPVALQIGGAGPQDFAALALQRYLLPAALIWAAGGWATARAGFLKAGMIILALVGAVSGGVLTVLAIAPEPAFLAAGGLGGLVYGLVGGMILGRLGARGEATP